MTVEERIRDRRITILGMARSGMAAARLALSLKGEPFVSDSASEETLGKQIEELRNLGIPHEVGGHTERVLASDYIVVSPGVPLKAPILKTARDRGIPVFSEIEFASWFCPARIVAVTGSNGKTTTTTLIAEILSAGGYDAIACGNIGRPLSDVVGKLKADSIAVVEVSSFQLESIESFRPHIAVILNLTPDHIDRHGSFELYKQAKFRITENQTADDFLVLNGEDRESVSYMPDTKARTLWYNTSGVKADVFVSAGVLSILDDHAERKVVKADEIAIKGPHNLQNSACATAVATTLGVKEETIARVLKSFPGVEHRLEHVGKVAGVTFINDSKATNVDSVCFALRSVTPPVYLILGGRDKAGDFRPIREFGKDKVKSIVLIGEAAQKIYETLGKNFPAEFCDSLEDAVNKCFDLARPGDTVLLSPGCASFDQFENFEQRGRVFKQAVAKLNNGQETNETVAG